ncbi:hypothetical protein [Mucilaginibacter xinganensis]|uniref:hypothetical protein n=1 Tax=Mucilaginibacter xinganensis TaxID=1234841 RepID=UPI000B99184C|nr:hypothetical protein [Mucilaginibacter xinganensis]
MKNSLSRSSLQQNRVAVFSQPSAILNTIIDPIIPDNLAAWLSKLALLSGVPFNYLVPDERMLPLESIRFFYLDPNWISALTDGAFSIGRNLTADTENASLNLDTALAPGSMAKVNAFKSNIRSTILGTDTPPPPTVISGFLLRSKVVQDYPGLGVNVYPLGGTPDDPTPKMLDLLRLEKLAANSDTMICLISGDAYRVDIHEAPQGLHYGIDCYNDNCTVNQKPAMAVKNLHTFTVNTTTGPTGTTIQSVTMSPDVTHTDISTSFRPNNTRVIDMTTLASTIATVNSVKTIDSAEMGFEMTEGVGMVSFFKTT